MDQSRAKAKELKRRRERENHYPCSSGGNCWFLADKSSIALVSYEFSAIDSMTIGNTERYGVLPFCPVRPCRQYLQL